jgi:hypothetical protein
MLQPEKLPERGTRWGLLPTRYWMLLENGNPELKILETLLGSAA